MKNLLLTITMLAIIGLSNLVNAQTLDWPWAKSGEGSDEERTYSVAIDAVGNIIVAGFFKSPAIDFGTTTLTNNNSGTSDIFLVKYDAAGNVIWAKSEGDFDNDAANSVAVDASGNIIVAGVFYSPTITFGTTTLTNAGTSDMFIVKYDPAGNVIWAKSEGGSDYEEAWFITTDASENLIVTGVFNSPTIIIGSTTLTNTVAGYSDMVVAKYDSSGNALWAKSADGVDNDVAYSVAADALGNIIVAGSFTSATLNFDSDTLTNSGSDDIFIAKYNSAGTELWAKSVGGSDSDYPYWVTADASGNLIVSGSFWSSTIAFASNTLANAGSGDIFILKYDSAGNELWAKSAGTPNYDFAGSVSADASGNLLVTGMFQNAPVTFGSITLGNAGGPDVFVVKYNSLGAELWATSTGGTYNDVGYSAIVDPLGDIIVAGYYASPTIDFGNTTLTNANTNNYNVFIAKLNVISGIESTENTNGISIYPNPAKDLLVISYPSLGNKEATISILDITGKIIYKTTSSSSQKTEVNTSNFAEGVYLIRIESKDFVEIRKLIKN